MRRNPSGSGRRPYTAVVRELVPLERQALRVHDVRADKRVRNTFTDDCVVGKHVVQPVARLLDVTLCSTRTSWRIGGRSRPAARRSDWRIGCAGPDTLDAVAAAAERQVEQSFDRVLGDDVSPPLAITTP